MSYHVGIRYGVRPDGYDTFPEAEAIVLKLCGWTRTFLSGPTVSYVDGRLRFVWRVYPNEFERSLNGRRFVSISSSGLSRAMEERLAAQGMDF